MSAARNRRVFGFPICLALILFTGGGCFGPDVRNPTVPDSVRRPGHVYVFRGAWNVFSGGLADLNQRLINERVDAHDCYVNTVGQTVDAILEDHARGDREPIILAGYSQGANNAMTTARYLADKGIAVDLVIMIDEFLAPATPRNIRRVLNIHSSGDGGVAVAEPHGPWTQSPKLERLHLTSGLGPLHHTTIHGDERMHDRVVAEVLRLSAAAQSRPAEPLTRP